MAQINCAFRRLRQLFGVPKAETVLAEKRAEAA